MLSMSLSPGALQLENVRCAWRPYRRGMVAEPVVRDWLEEEGIAAVGELDLSRNVHGRPVLVSVQGGHDVSWSHSGEGLLMALGNGVRVGCDLEWARPRPNSLEVAQRFFCAREAQWLADLPEPQRDSTFVAIWCGKEAVLKAHGRGIAFGLHRLEFGESDGRLELIACDPELGTPQSWSLHSFSPAPGYLATLAWQGIANRSG